MKKSRLTLDIIGIIVGFFASLIFFLPVWNFTSNTTIHEKKTTLITANINLFDRESIKEIMFHYDMYSQKLNLTFAYIFVKKMSKFFYLLYFFENC